MRVLVKNGATVEVIAVNYACPENSNLFIQDITGSTYYVPGFVSFDEVNCCLMELFRVGRYDFTPYGSVVYLDGGDISYFDGGDD